MAQQYQPYRPEDMVDQQQDPTYQQEGVAYQQEGAAYQQQDPADQQQYEASQQQENMAQQPQEMGYQGQNMEYEAPSSDDDPSAEKNLSSSQQWANGFWSCCTPFKLCFKTCCCPCFVFGKTQARNSGDQDASSCNGMCMGWYFLGCLGAHWILQGYKRHTYRRTHGIEGSPLKDFAGALCCPCCGLMQEEKESLKRVEEQKNLIVAESGYQQNPEMAYQQQEQGQEQGQVVDPDMAAYQQQQEQGQVDPEMAAYQQQQQQQMDQQDPEMIAYQQQQQQQQQQQKNQQMGYQ